MPIPTECPTCHSRFSVPSKYAGKRIKCPYCRRPIPVAAPPKPEGSPVDRASQVLPCTEAVPVADTTNAANPLAFTTSTHISRPNDASNSPAASSQDRPQQQTDDVPADYAYLRSQRPKVQASEVILRCLVGSVIGSVGGAVGGFVGYFLHENPQKVAVPTPIQFYLIGGTILGVALGCLEELLRYVTTIQMLRQSGSPEAYPDLNLAFEHGDLPALMRAARCRDNGARMAAIKLLKQLGSQAAPAVSVLALALPERVPIPPKEARPAESKLTGHCRVCGLKLTFANRNLFSRECSVCLHPQQNTPELRLAAVQTLGQIGSAAKPVIPELAGLLDDGGTLAEAALDAIRLIDPQEARRCRTQHNN